MAWTNVAKPTESSITTGVVGEAIGLLLAFTIDTASSSITSGWTSISKPTASVGAWTNIVKPT